MNYLLKIWLIYQSYGILELIHIIIKKVSKGIYFNFNFSKYKWLKISALQKPIDKILFKNVEQPTVSIIIPVYNNSIYTYNCLKSIAENTSCLDIIEVIVVDDQSTDDTEKVLALVSEIKIIANTQNQGFISSCNQGALIAKGKYLCFLNNDTKVLQGWLENLIIVVEQDPKVGAVGSKLIYPNGKLQEAGGIIWNDGTGCNYGKNDSINSPEYNYLREVDYCSGASLLVRADLFKQIDGFSKEFLPAYYEDTDFCFFLRHHLGYKVVYQPKSEIIHYEGITSGTNLETGVKSYQKLNQEKFKLKWQNTLKEYYSPEFNVVYKASRRLIAQPTILIIDSYVPRHDKEAGSLRLFNIIKALLKLNYSVVFMPDNSRKEEPYTSELQSLGIEVLYETHEIKLSSIKKLTKQIEMIDIAWICRPNIGEKYINLIKTNPKIKIIYDTVDLHFIRLKRQLDNSSFDSSLTKQWEKYKQLELSLANLSTTTTVVTEVEKDILKSLGVKNVFCIPIIFPIYKQSIPSFNEREGLLFIGSYLHTPNIDAVIWLCEEIMPLIWLSHPNIKVTLLGSNPPKKIKELANQRVIITGYINDVEPYFLSHKVFVAPLRFGAGMKGKINQSLSYGLPVVTTKIGAEGMNLEHNKNVLISEQSQDFAKSILSLYTNIDLWDQISNESKIVAQLYSPEFVSNSIKTMLNKL